MGIYGTIFRKLTGKEKKPKTKKRKKMAKRKLTTDEKIARRKRITEAFKKAGTQISKYSGGKPTVRVKAKPTTPPAPTKTQPGINFWNSQIDMGFIKPTGKQLVIGGTATIIGGALIYRALK